MKGLVKYGIFLGLLAPLGAAQAVPTGYNDRAAFDAAVAGIPNTSEVVLTLESEAPGTTYPSGATIGAITFTYTLGGTSPSIGIPSPAPGGTSGNNTLAYHDSPSSGAFFGGFGFTDSITFSLATASHAFGLYLVVSNINFDFLDGDATLSFAGTTFPIAATDTATLVNGVPALFLGIVDPAATFLTANLTFNAPGTEIGQLDDFITTVTRNGPPPPQAVPEPGPLALMAIGVGSLCLRRRLL